MVAGQLGIDLLGAPPQLSKDKLVCTLDMRPLRAWLVRSGVAEQTACLNLICYTGAFSLSAAAVHGAQTTSVDLSRAYLDRAIENFPAQRALAAEEHRFVESDTFAALDRLRRKGQSV